MVSFVVGVDEYESDTVCVCGGVLVLHTVFLPHDPGAHRNIRVQINLGRTRRHLVRVQDPLMILIPRRDGHEAHEARVLGGCDRTSFVYG